MSCEPEGSASSWFSARYSLLTSSAGGLSGADPPQNSDATLRVPLAMPQRSMNQRFGSSDTTTIEPGGDGLCLDTNG